MSDEFYSNDRNSASPGGQIIPLRRPPHSTEAEQAVLGGLLLDNSAWRTVAELLTAADFYRSDHHLGLNSAPQPFAGKGRINP
jgi:hypothetical protein